MISGQTDPAVLTASDIVSAILSGKHPHQAAMCALWRLETDILSSCTGPSPPELTARRLMEDTRLPLDWNEQRLCLGFASVHQ